MPSNRRALHWAQLQVYGALLCAERGLAEIELALVYFDVATQDETVLTERHSAASLQQCFEERCRPLSRLGRAGGRASSCARCGAGCTALSARRLPARVSARCPRRSTRRPPTGRCLIAQAPTGIGKTVGTLFPLLKACPGKAARQGVLPDREDTGARPGTRRLASHPRQRAGVAASRDRTGRAREIVRAPRQGLPRRLLSAGTRLLRPAGLRAGRCHRASRARQDHAARGRAGASGLPVLPVTGAGPLERRGGRRLQPLVRPERAAAWPDAGARMARRRAGRRGAQT